MAPTIVLIRHAQALHNVDNKSARSPCLKPRSANRSAQEWDLHDPELTSLGIEQCKDLRQNLSEKFSDVKDAAIIVSPMRRTIQTALLSLDWLLERGAPIEADARWQENSAKPCDTGSPVEKLVEEFPNIDYSTVDPVYPDKTSPAGANYAFTRQAILGRAQSGLESLRQRPEKYIFVVSHSGFLRAGLTGYWFFNADYRVFEVSSDGSLEQWDSTAAGGLGRSRLEPVQIGEELPEEDIKTPPDA